MKENLICKFTYKIKCLASGLKNSAMKPIVFENKLV